MLQSKAGYIDARPHHLIDEPLATHGRTIHRVKLRSPGTQSAGRLYPQLQTNRCIGPTDAMGHSRHSSGAPKNSGLPR
ncbi:hypothetical protein DXU04_24640 [Bradyrhizobium diazoefficiens]